MALPSLSSPRVGWVPHAMGALNRVYTRGFHRLDILSPWKIPSRGPAILVANHTSGLDPLLIQSCSQRLITWMMAREYYDQPFMRSAMQQIGAIPVTRNGRDMTAARDAMRALDRGAIIGIFPEGRIEKTRDLLPFQTGVALLAARGQSPVYTAYLDGTQRGKEMADVFFHPQRATIAFGPRVPLGRIDASRDALESATSQIETAMRKLRQDATKSNHRRDL